MTPARLGIIIALLAITLLGATGALVYRFARRSNQPIREEISLSPTRAAFPTISLSDTTVPANWKTYTSEKGYSFKYPPELIFKEGDVRFFYFSEQRDGKGLEGLSFYIDERGQKTIAERKQYTLTDFLNPLFKGLDRVNGFTVEGKLGPGFGEGLYVKSAYIDFNGRELILGCDTNKICQEKILDQILSTFKFTISDQEKQQIDAWLEQNNLNQYGDPKDTMYAGGTPLFDERTGERTDRYDYILKKFPDRPWGK